MGPALLTGQQDWLQALLVPVTQVSLEEIQKCASAYGREEVVTAVSMVDDLKRSKYRTGT